MSNAHSNGTQIKIGPGRSQGVDKGSRVLVTMKICGVSSRRGKLTSANGVMGIVEFDNIQHTQAIPLEYITKA